MRNGIPLLVASLLALTPLIAAGPAQARLTDPVQLPIGKDQTVVGASSGAGQRLAVTLRRDADGSSRVAVQGAGGRWRQVEFATRPNAIRLAQLEGGGGLVAWDAGDAVYVRTWDHAGAFSPARAVLTGIDARWEGDSTAAGWHLSSDRAGTVVIAAPGLAAGGVYATVRDPGGDFSAPQELLAPGPQAERQPGVMVSPIATDGTVVVSWGPHAEGPDVRSSRATGAAARNGRAPVFSPAGPGAAVTDPAIWLADDSRSVRVAGDVLTLCRRASLGCRSPKLFTWKSGEQVLVFRKNFSQSFIARRGTDGRFANPRLASRSEHAVWTSTPGQVAFLVASAGDYARRGRGVYLVPVGTTPRQSPHLHLQSAASTGGVLRVSVFCSTECRVGGATLQPFQVRTTRVSTLRPGATRVRVTLTARDTRGRSARLVKTLRRGPLTGNRRIWLVTP